MTIKVTAKDIKLVISLALATFDGSLTRKGTVDV